MRTEEVHATQVNEKVAMTELPEADEDARTESSEGSNPQPDATDSEDEFEDAMAPPSSTSSMLMVFDDSAPPLSGVYEDALEATEEQVAAALGSTSSDGGRQSTILEGNEEGEEEVENAIETEDASEIEVMAVVEGIVEAAVTAVGDEGEDTDGVVPAEQDLGVDTSEEIVVEELGSAKETKDKVAAEEDAEEPEAIDQTQEEQTCETEDKEAAKEEEVARRQEVEEENIDDATAEENAASEDVEKSMKAMNDAAADVNNEQAVNEEPVDKASVDKKEVNSTVVIETEGQAAARLEARVAPLEGTSSESGGDGADEETIAAESAQAAAVNIIAEGVAAQDESGPIVAGTETSSAVEAKSPATTEVSATTCEGEVVTGVTEGEDVVDETPVEDIPDADAAVENENVEMATVEETAEAEPATPETIDPTEESEKELSHELSKAHEPEINDETPMEKDVVADGADEVAAEDGVMEKPVAEEVAEEESRESTAAADEAADEAANPEGEEALVDELDEATQPEESTSETSGEESTACGDVEEAVIQVANDLVEAVQTEYDTDEVGEADPEATVEEAFEEKPEVHVAVEQQDTEESPASNVSDDATPEKTDTSKQDNEAVSLDNEENFVDNNAEHLVVDTQAGGIAPEQKPVEEKTETEAAPVYSDAEGALVSKEESGDADEQNHVVLGLLPRLEPSSGTTTTTTIEPFILSTESVEVHLPPQRWIYEVYGFSIQNRVVYYHIHKTDRRTGIRDPPILKRYTDFRELQLQLLDTCPHAAADMPRIPRPHLGTVFRGYKSKKTIEVREQAFRALLRYISQYPALHGSGVFERFIETSRASPGAGWI